MFQRLDINPAKGMATEVKRSRYKVFLIILKFIPMLLAIDSVVNTFLAFIGIDS